MEFPHADSDIINIKIGVITTIQWEQPNQYFLARLPCKSFPNELQYSQQPPSQVLRTHIVQRQSYCILLHKIVQSSLFHKYPASQELSLQFSTEFFKHVLGYEL